MARSRVANLLVTSTTGAFSSSDHATCRNSAPYLASRLIPATLALVVQVLPAGRNQSGALKAGSGTQACAWPPGLPISSRVTVWKVRHAPGLGANAPCAIAAPGSAVAAATAAPAFKTSRLLIVMLRPPCC